MPFKPNERIYRSFAASNFQKVEVANQEDSNEPSYVTRGHFTVFDVPYELCEGFYEEIDSHALDGTDLSDVIFQVDHRDTPLARIRNHSLSIGIDQTGGWCEADLGGSQRGREIHEAIANGLIDRMSFGFTIAEDGFEWSEDDNGVIHSRITKIKRLYDVSCVTWPASEYTDISARAYVDAAIEAKKKAEELRAAQEAEETPEEPIETPEEPVEEPEETTEEPMTEEELIEETLNRRSRLKRRARALSLKAIQIDQ